ncbi:MAG: hypothetical protein IT281_08930 [Ignavibacteria bacterium]|nr:hypothetical protein [Ignavibacteria bacterium]MCC7159649.1 hypothetical protein [Ignavibacteria bacterium]
MNKLKYFLIFAFVLSSVIYIGCGEDSTGPGTTTGTPPTINMKVNSFYAFTNDSLDTNGTTVRPTKIKTYQTYLAQGTFFGQSNAFMIRSESKDTSLPPPNTISIDTFYVRYDGGKFYQYGMLRLIDSTQSPTWDMVADFNKAIGVQWDIATINTNVGGFAVTSVVKGKIAEKSSFTTNVLGNSINCYRIEIEAQVSTLGTSAGSIFVDYYIGYSDPATNPSGMVRIKLRPIKLSAFGATFYRAAGLDTKIQYYVIP